MVNSVLKAKPKAKKIEEKGVPELPYTSRKGCEREK